MNLRIKKQVESIINKKIIKLEEIKYGGANTVYKIITEDYKSYVYKIYKIKRNFDIIDNLNSYLKREGIETLDVIKRGKIQNDFYYLYTKNKGIHKYTYTQNMIDKILDVINVEYKNIKNSFDSDNSITKKYFFYQQYFYKNKTRKIQEDIIEYINRVSHEIKIDNAGLCLVHGDLSITNILWDKEKFSLIDFDEAIYAPIEYELVSFLIKTCFNRNNFNKKLAFNIMKRIKMKFNNINYYSFKNAWNLYITKVIYEKFYYYELGYTDIENEEHKRDYWKWWFELLKNKGLFNNIYFNDIELPKLNNYEKILKLEGETLVSIVKVEGNKFILKKHSNNPEKDANDEQLILDYLSTEMNVPRILKYERDKDYTYKLYTLLNGQHRTKLTKKEEICLLREVNQLMLLLNKLDINVKIGSIEEKIEKLISETKDSFYKECLKNLLLDKRFINRTNYEEKMIVHDDLNLDNILFDKDNVYLLDFEGLKKYPKTLQVASFLTNIYMYQGNNENIDFALSKLNYREDRDYIIKLIIFRTLKTLVFFEEKIINGNKKYIKRKNTLYNSLREFLNKNGRYIMEVRDYYNIRKEPTGETYLANIEPSGDNYMLITVCFIQNSDGDYLIQKASKQKGNKWGSTGGHPLAGESSIQGMKREIKEELGVYIEEDKYEYVNTFMGHNKILDLYYINENIDISKLELQKEEVESVKWATSEEIEKLIKRNEFEKTHSKLFRDIQRWIMGNI